MENNPGDPNEFLHATLTETLPFSLLTFQRYSSRLAVCLLALANKATPKISRRCTNGQKARGSQKEGAQKVVKEVTQEIQKVAYP
jgi:hypothetical protein